MIELKVIAIFNVNVNIYHRCREYSGVKALSIIHTVMPKGEKIGGPVVIGGHNLASPGWN